MKIGWLRSRKVWLLILTGGLLAVLGSNLPLSTWLFQFKDWLLALGPWASPTFIVIYLLATILGVPNILFVLVAGTLFGLIQGIIYVSTADTLAAIACFLLGRTIMRKRIQRWLSKRPNFAQLDAVVGKQGWKILLLTRLSPLVPSSILNYGFSCTKVSFWQYCFFSWLGMLPVISLYVYLGSFSSSMLEGDLTPEKLALQVVGVLLAICAALYTTRLAKKQLSSQNAK